MFGEKGSIEKDFLGYIPELPDVAASFIKLSKEFISTNNSYASLLLHDSTLASRVFAYINCVLSSNKTPFVSLNKGVSVMGLHRFKNVVISLALFPLFEEAGCVDLFKYSITTAHYAEAIADEYNFINSNDAFLLGLLHDIGKLVLKNKFKDDYVLFPFRDNDIKEEYTLEDETANFGYCHTDISEYICKLWELPFVISDAVKYHHFPLSAMLPQASSLIFLSDVLMHRNLRSTSDAQKVLQYMQLTKNEVAKFAAICDKKVLPYFEVLNIA